MNLKHQEINILFKKLFDKEEQKQIEYIYNKVQSDDPFENWRKYVDGIDKKIGGIGSDKLMVYIDDKSGYTGKYRGNERGTYRCLQYVLAYFFWSRSDLTRLGIDYCCMHIENILKIKYNSHNLPLGAIVHLIKDNKLENEDMIKILELVTPIWNEAKHDVDEEALEFNIDEDELIFNSQHKFSVAEVITMYFICRKIGVMLKG